LLNRSVLICGGGGGAPVVEDDKGRLSGVEAVVDKDFTAALLAIAVRADRLLVLTDVPAVMRDFGTARAGPIRSLGLTELASTNFPAGSMGPKIEACRQFVVQTGRPAAIGALGDVAGILAGTTGTTITARDDHDEVMRDPVGENRSPAVRSCLSNPRVAR
jgi:carbamate kinase